MESVAEDGLRFTLLVRTDGSLEVNKSRKGKLTLQTIWARPLPMSYDTSQTVSITCYGVSSIAYIDNHRAIRVRRRLRDKISMTDSCWGLTHLCLGSSSLRVYFYIARFINNHLLQKFVCRCSI